MPRQRASITLAGALLLAAAVPVAAQTAVGPGFTYQGRLMLDGAALNDIVDLRFTLYDGAGTGNPPTGGTQIGSAQTIAGVVVADGLFTVTLNGGGEFGSTAFNGQARWLEVAVRSPAWDGSGSEPPLTTLAPRQSLTATPYAQRALSAPNGYALDAVDGSQPNAVYVGNGGRVGIGTTNPQQKLHLAGATSTSVLFEDQSPGGVNYHVGFNTSDHTFRIAQTGVADRLVFTPAGRIGMGTVAPAFHLDVVSAANGVARFRSSDTFGSLISLYNDSTGGTNWSLISTGSGHTAGAGKLVFRNVGAASDRAAFDGAGNLGVGTTSPLSRLHLLHNSLGSTDWSVRIQNVATAFQGGLRQTDGGFLEATNIANGVFNVARLDSTGNWTSVSDRRRKREIEPLTNVLPRALRLAPVSFRYDIEQSDSTLPKSIGFVAQEVQPLFPSLVTDDGDTMTLNYSGLSVVAIAALQEQQAVIASLKEENADKDARLAALEERLERLEATLADIRP